MAIDFPYKKVHDYLIGKGLLKFEHFRKSKDVKSTIHRVLEHGENYPTLDEWHDEHCGVFEYRTISDIHRILNFYHPNTSIQDTYAALYEHGKEGTIHSWICSEIRKRVYFISIPECGKKFNTNEEDEFGFRYEKIGYGNSEGNNHGYVGIKCNLEIYD